MQRSPNLHVGLVGVITTVLVAALFAGCGSGESGEASASAPLSKKEFIKRGNVLCDKVLLERDEAALKAYKEHLAEIKNLPKSDLVRLDTELALEIDLPIYRRLVRELGKLRPPASDEKTVEKMLSNYESLLDRLFEHPHRLREMARPLPPYAEASAYGLISCTI